MLESVDLRNWAIPSGSKNPLGMILTKGGHTYGTTGFWAPQIFKTANGYYLAYTANEQTVLARSNELLGPYSKKKQAQLTVLRKTSIPIFSGMMMADIFFTMYGSIMAITYGLENWILKKERLNRAH
jgi:beta-xylosidase